jgi:hypothetical protein
MKQTTSCSFKARLDLKKAIFQELIILGAPIWIVVNIGAALISIRCLGLHDRTSLTILERLYGISTAQWNTARWISVFMTILNFVLFVVLCHFPSLKDSLPGVLALLGTWTPIMLYASIMLCYEPGPDSSPGALQQKIMKTMLHSALPQATEDKDGQWKEEIGKKLIDVLEDQVKR